ncbi:hypothetical protein BDV95DRAFT_665765 [Massariosphaeria phaeospora]|uniref:RING-type domain-containing protein n=1 Tax=Massariosphaeria phaeospora TaxID=100035 RepID=A0A7C8MF96_9PLEO|nr:hypothetical protein BDV95DRAFT_665765 [Massariosphaeria phaeospora]
MADPATDAKAARLAEELKEFALTLPTPSLPKNLLCALCSELAVDAWKLQCCNKPICTPCQAKLEFPTTCPLCEHHPLESDLCVPHKALRNTMRVWLTKQKKKEEAKAAAAAPAPVPAATGPEAAAAGPPLGDTSDKQADSVGAAQEGDDGPSNQAAVATESTELGQRVGSAGAEHNGKSEPETTDEQRRESISSSAAKRDGPDGEAVVQDATFDQNSMDNSTNGMQNSDAMMNINMNNMGGYGYNANANNFNMGFGGMNGMNPMMNTGNWANMHNNMDYNMMGNMNGMPSMSNGMYGGFGGNMANMNMMNYGGGFGNGWNGMNSGYGYANGGFNQSGSYPGMNFPNNSFAQNRSYAPGGSFQQRNNRNGSFGGNGIGTGPGKLPSNSRPGSRAGPAQHVRSFHNLPPASATPPRRTDVSCPQQSDGQSPAAAREPVVGNEQAKTSLETAHEGKDNARDTSDSTSPFTRGGAEVLTPAAGDQGSVGGLNPIQTVDSIETDEPNYGDMSMGAYVNPMGGYSNDFGGNGGYNTAYGAATVLTGEPRGVGVEGAPTGPRAMREGRPNTGFSSRIYKAQSTQPPPSATPVQDVRPGSPPRKPRSRSPERDETLRTKDKSVTRSASKSPANDQRIKDEPKSRSPEREAGEGTPRERSTTPKVDEQTERKNRHEDARKESSRHDERTDRGELHDEQNGDYRNDRQERRDRTRSASVDSKYHSHRNKDKHRSSRSHRDRSQEHRRRHRSRSRSPGYEARLGDDDYVRGVDQQSESGARRKSRAEKDKHRERDRDRERHRSRERDRDRRDRREREHDRDHEHDREKDRSRDKDKDRKRRRDRDRDDEDNRDYENEKSRSSRRSRRDRDRDRDYDNEPSSATSARPLSPPPNAPTGPSADGFSIRGISKTKKDSAPTMPPPQPPAGPRGFVPPKGPAADRERRDSRDHRRKFSINSAPPTPSSPSAQPQTQTQTQDHYAAERERNARERDRLDRGSRDTFASDSHSHSHDRALSLLSTKRSRDDFEFEPEAAVDKAKDKDRDIPTGPAAHKSKRAKASSGTDSISNLFTAGLRKQAAKRERRGGVKTEGSAERDLERVERERDGRRR